MNEVFVGIDALYPLKFTPIYQERIWGGTQFREVLRRKLPETASPIGESWELVDRDDVVSRVANGPLAGRTIGELIHHYGRHLLGRKAKNCDRFPLLVKLIDAGERLSLQVHPDEAACARIGGTAEPKTEMWYVISALPGANILAGLSDRATRNRLVDLISSPEVETLLQNYQSQPGDAYYIPAGTLHAIGAGNLILEIQQNSDTTYRISDWGRVDASGKSRELHVDKGMLSINFMNRTSPRIAGTVGEAGHNRKFDVVNLCPFFKVDDLRLTGQWIDDTLSGGSFHLISAVNAPVSVGKEGTPARRTELAAGETALVPAGFGSYTIEPMLPGESTVIRTML